MFFNTIQIRVLSFALGLISGDQPPTPILDSIQAAGDARFLLIAAENEAHEAPYNEVFAEAVGERAEVWVVPDAGHTQGLRRAGAEYEQRVIGFFEAALLGEARASGG